MRIFKRLFRIGIIRLRLNGMIIIYSVDGFDIYFFDILIIGNSIHKNCTGFLCSCYRDGTAHVSARIHQI